MKSLVFIKPGKVEWREVKKPIIDQGCQAVVKPLVIGRCDLDVAYLNGMLPMLPGTEIGHEIVGEVVDLGDDVSNFQLGDLVIVPSQISCGTCNYCVRGFTGRCTSVPFGASYGMGREGGFGGGAADLVKVPFADAMLFHVPKNANPVDWIGFADMAQDAYRAVGPPLKQRPHARVLVIGGNPSVIGIYSAAIAVALGASDVDYYDNDHQRLAQAAKYGANAINRNYSEPTGFYDVVVDSLALESALIEAFRFAAPEALVTSVSVHLGEFAKAPLMEAYHKGVFYRTARPNCRQYMEDVKELCCKGYFQPELIDCKTYKFDDAPQAWVDSSMRTIAVR